MKRLSVIIIFLTSLISIVLSLLVPNNKEEYFAYTNKDIFLVDIKTNSEKNITNFNNHNFTGLKFEDNQLLYLNCEKHIFQEDNMCSISSYDPSTTETSIIGSINNDDYIPSTFRIIKRDLYLFNSRDKLYMQKGDNQKEVLSWDLNYEMGIGGNLCNGVSTWYQKPEFISFCYSSALLTSIQGSLYILDLEGNIVKVITSDIEGSVEGILFHRFIGSNEIIYLDNSNLYLYNILAESRQLITDKIDSFKFIDDQFIEFNGGTSNYDLLNRRIVTGDIDSLCLKSRNCNESEYRIITRN